MLLALSNRVLDSVGSGYADFRLMHVPVSTALMTVYSEDYFGIGQAAADTETENVEAGGENA